MSRELTPAGTARLSAPGLVLALALAGFGCAPEDPFPGCDPDTAPTKVSREVLVGYGDREDRHPRSPARPVCALPVENPPTVVMPGAADRPWSGPPRMPTEGLGGPAHVAQGTDSSGSTGPAVPPVTTAGPPNGHSTAPEDAPGGAHAKPPDEHAPPVRVELVLSAGDSIDVEVAEHPAFNGRWRVRPDGFLDIPEGGAFGPMLLSAESASKRLGAAAGSSPDELAGRISALLQPYVKKSPVVKVVPAARREG